MFWRRNFHGIRIVLFIIHKFQGIFSNEKKRLTEENKKSMDLTFQRYKSEIKINLSKNRENMKKQLNAE